MTRVARRTPVPGHDGRLAGASASSFAELRLLNAFELRVDKEPVFVPLPAQRVLAFVALLDRPVLRAAAAGRLWMDCTDAHAMGSLRSALWRLRREPCALVDGVHGRLQLAPGVAVDVRALLGWTRRQLDGSGTDDDEGASVDGELLPDWYDDWVVLERERVRELRVRALEALCDRLTAAGAYARASEAARAAIGDDPLRESAHRCLVRVHLAEGNAAEAIRAYRLFRKLLLDALGLEPSARMMALVDGVMVQ